LAYYLNRYLQTGNEEYLDLVLPYWQRNYEMYEFYRKLRECNLTLEPGERIEIIGFDITGTFRQIIAVYHLLEEDCSLLEPYSPEGSLPYSSDFQHMDLLKEAAPGDLVLFDLQGEASPFARDLFFLEEGASGGTTLDYFQMVIYFEGFEGASPLYGNR